MRDFLTIQPHRATFSTGMEGEQPPAMACHQVQRVTIDLLAMDTPEAAPIGCRSGGLFYLHSATISLNTSLAVRFSRSGSPLPAPFRLQHESA